GVARADEVDVGPPALVVVVKAGNIRLLAIHDRQVESGRGGRDPNAHRREPVIPASQEAPQEGHQPALQRPLEHAPRERVDLDDEEPTPAGNGPGAKPESTDQPVEPVLGAQKQIVQGRPRRPANGGARPGQSARSQGYSAAPSSSERLRGATRRSADSLPRRATTA